MSSAGPFRAALGRRAGESPEDPFLFFRGERGHFRWWSFARAAACLTGSPGAASGRAGEAEAEAFLRSADDAGSPAAAEALPAALGPSPEGRDIWISVRPLALSVERDLALWAAETGAAVLREPGERLHPELFVWARPTLLSGTEPELAALADGFAALAPRLGARRWRRRRLARLRAILVESGSPDRVAARFAAAGASATLRVLSFPGPGW